jgi:hypothetical protein
VTGFRLLALLCLPFVCSTVCAQAAPSAPAQARDDSEDAAPFASALRVEVISCVLEESAVDVTEMLAIARAELAPHVLVRAGEKNSQPLLRVDACHDERLVLRLLSPEGPEQSVALHDVPPEHRPRVAALALAELVLTARAVSEWRAERAAKSEPPAEKSAAPPPPAPAPPDNSASGRLPDWNPPSPPAPHAMRLGFGTEARLFMESLSVSYGPRLTLRLPRVDLVLLGLISRRKVDLGELQTSLIALSAAVHLWRSKGAVDVAVSLGAEIGVSWGKAEPDSATYGLTSDAQAQFASGFGQVTLGGAISDQAYAHAGLAVGYAFGVHAEVDGEELGTRGAFAGLSVGFAWLL